MMNLIEVSFSRMQQVGFSRSAIHLPQEREVTWRIVHCKILGFLCLMLQTTPLLGLRVAVSRMPKDCPGTRLNSNLWSSLAITTLASIWNHIIHMLSLSLWILIRVSMFGVSTCVTHLCKLLSQTGAWSESKGEVTVVGPTGRWLQ